MLFIYLFIYFFLFSYVDLSTFVPCVRFDDGDDDDNDSYA